MGRPLASSALVVLFTLGAARASAIAEPCEQESALASLSSSDAGTRREGARAVERCFVAAPASSRATIVSRLRELVRSREPTTRAAATGVAGRLDDAEALRAWLGRLDPDEDDRVIAAALEAVGERAPGSAVERALVAALREGAATAGRRALLLDALGGCRGPAADGLLATPRPGADWVEESGRALGLGRRVGVGAIAPLIEILGNADPAPRVHAWEGLSRITRERLPAERAPWAAWWAAHRTSWSATGTSSPSSPAASRGDARYVGATPAHVPRYYGIPIARPRSRVVFCLDVSASMGGSGIEHARAHLARTLKELPSTHAFELVCFQERVTAWADRLVTAHPVSKARAIAFLDAQDPVSFTNLWDAAERAFSYAGRGRHPAVDASHVDAVFVLSDGAPNRGRFQTADAVVDGIAALSARTIPVHTIGAGESVAPLLRRIAAATGGVFADAAEFE